MDLKEQLAKEIESLPICTAGTEWRILSRKWVEAFISREEPGPVQNEDILCRDNFLRSPDESYLNRPLIPSALLHKDYEIVSISLWDSLVQAFGAQGDSVIARFSREISETETQVEVSLTPLQVVFVPKLSVGKIVSTQPETVYVSKFSLIGDVKRRLINISNARHSADEQYITKDSFARLWKLDIDKTYSDIAEIERMQLQTMSNDHAFQFPGELLPDEHNLDDAKVSPSDLIAMEAKDLIIQWRFCTKTPKCKACGALVRSMKTKCDCGKEVYCSERCRNQARHSCEQAPPPRARAQAEPLSLEPLRLSQKGGLSGLQNLGNTCYMNSALQCALHTQFLVDFFVSSEYRQKINRRNPIGYGGRIAETFAGLMIDVWIRAERAVAPWDMKQAIGRYSPLFQGYHQHDSQELLSFLLDGLHEDVNEVTEKPYIEELKLERIPTEEEKARVVWNAHLSRNRSVIVENMYGQYRLQLTCPKCKVVSFAYDPFLTLTVDMPKKGKQLQITYVPLDLKQRPRTLLVSADKAASLEVLRQSVAEKLKFENKDAVLLALMKDCQFRCWANLTHPLSKYLKEGLTAFEVLPNSAEKVHIVLEMTKKYRSYLIFSSETPFTLPRLVYLDPRYSAAELHRAVFAHFSHWIPGLRSDRHPVTDQLLMDTFPQLFGRSGDSAPDPYVLKTKEKTAVPFEDRKPFAAPKIEDFVSVPAVYQLYWQDHTDEVQQACSPLQEPKERESVGRTLTLAECLAASCSPRELDAANAWSCPTCGKVQAMREMTIFRASKVLVIHLKRFKQSGGYMKKNDHQVIVPKVLDISPFMKNSPYTSQPRYSLYAVSNHSGGLGGGHYTAFAQVASRWYSFNDSSVHPVDESQVCAPSTSAYVLCYSRLD